MKGAPKGELRIFLKRRLQTGRPLYSEEKLQIARDFEASLDRVTALSKIIKEEIAEEEKNRVRQLAFGEALEDLLKKIGFDDVEADYVIGPSVLGTPWREWKMSGWSTTQAVRARKIIAKTAVDYLPEFDKLLERFHHLPYVKKMSGV